jgi:hypothetical protein
VVNTWYYAAGVYDSVSDVHRFMVNSVVTSNATAGVTIANTQPFQLPAIGSRPANSEYWNGTIDEVRISNTARSTDWLNETYQVVANQTSYVTFGSEENNPPIVSLILPGNNSVSNKSIVNFTFNVTRSANLAGCSLMIDGVSSNTTTPAGVNGSMTSVLSPGDHLWYVNCTDIGGFTNRSEQRNISIQIIARILNVTTTNVSVVLNAGTRKTVECNVSVIDTNGTDYILGTNMTFYTPPSTGSSAETNVSKYSNTSCSVTGTGVDVKNYTCTVQLLYYTANGTWICNATSITTTTTANNATNFTVDPLYAINVTSTDIVFGDLGAGQISPNVSINTTNVGNQRINVSIYGYGRVAGDNVGFTCPVTNVSIEYIRFSTLIAAAYDQKTNLSSGPQWLNYSTPAQSGPAIIMQNASYWQASIPLGFPPQGLCNGTVVFQAEAP